MGRTRNVGRVVMHPGFDWPDACVPGQKQIVLKFGSKPLIETTFKKIGMQVSPLVDRYMAVCPKFEFSLKLGRQESTCAFSCTAIGFIDTLPW